MLLIMLMAFLALFEVVKLKLDERQAQYLMIGLLVLVAVGVLALEAVGIIAPITGKF